MLVSPESQRLPNLLVFAHADEASAFDDIAHVVTGVGKVHAATELAHELANAGWAGVTVLGTAGIVGSVSTAHAEAAGNGAAGTEATDLEVTDPEPASSAAVLPLDLDTVYQIDAVLQHNFALPSPTLRPMGELICDPAHRASIATGDVFVASDIERARIAALGASLVDMESYAYAAVCDRFNIPLQIFKVPSDFADDATTATDWDEIVALKSRQLRAFWDERLQ